MFVLEFLETWSLYRGHAFVAFLGLKQLALFWPLKEIYGWLSVVLLFLCFP